jgi:hypothetical protein
LAVSAKFLASFENLHAGIEKTEQKFRSLKSTSTSTGDELSKLERRFSGQGLIRAAVDSANAIDRLGGTSILTGKELQRASAFAAEAAEKMTRLGHDVPGNLQRLADAAQKPVGAFSSLLGVVGKIAPALGVGLSLGAVTSFAKGISDFAGTMTDLAAETQISTSRLQAFNYVGTGVGLNIDNIAGSADQLAKRLGGDDDSVNAALAKMNLSGQQLKQLSLDEVMFRIDEGLTGVGNQFDRARILADLFGKSGAQLGRLMDGSLREAITSVENTSAVIDEELIKKAAEFGDRWDQAWLHFRGFAVDAIGAVGKALGGLSDAAAFGIRPGAFGAPSAQPGRSPRRIGGTSSQIDATGLPSARVENGRVVFGASDFSDTIEGGGIKSVIEESAIAKELREWAAKTREAAAATERWARNLQGEFLRAQDAAFLNSPTSEATRRLQQMTMRAGFGGVLPSSRIDGLFSLPGSVGNRNDSAGFGILSKGTSIGSSLKGALGGIPDVILGALQGGGDITKSIGSLLGGSLLGSGTGLNKAISGGIGKLFGDTVGGLASSILPGIGSLLGPAISGLGKVFGGLFGGEGKKTNRARDSEISDFTGLSDKGAAQAKFREMAMAAGIAATEVDKVFSTGKMKTFEADFARLTGRIREFTGDQEADSERLAAAIEKYGIAFEEAGAAFQKQQLDKQAKELVEDWRVLVGSGIDLGVVNEKMSEAINEYLQTAVRVGQEMPAAMRPILQKMLEQGTLTDEAGNAITDMETAGIKFSETMTEGFDRVVKKLDELLTKLGQAGSALAGLPSVPSVPDGIWDSSNASPSDLQGFAGGTRGRYLNFGSGTPVMLHGNERVSTEAEGRAEAGAWAAMVGAVDAMRGDLQRFAEAQQRGMRDQIAIAMGRTA